MKWSKPKVDVCSVEDVEEKRKGKKKSKKKRNCLEMQCVIWNPTWDNGVTPAYSNCSVRGPVFSYWGSTSSGRGTLWKLRRLVGSSTN